MDLTEQEKGREVTVLIGEEQEIPEFSFGLQKGPRVIPDWKRKYNILSPSH